MDTQELDGTVSPVTTKSSKKVIEQYFDVYNELIPKYTALGHRKIALLYQVGSFFECYGLEYPPNHPATSSTAHPTQKHNMLEVSCQQYGTIWEFADDLNLRAVHYKKHIYRDDPTIKVYIAGIPVCTKDKYYQLAERANWTLIRFEQVKSVIDNSYERVISEITSPGININSISPSNIIAAIILESVPNYERGHRSNTIDTHIIYSAFSYIDCITGENGVVNITPQSSSNITIMFDEILKHILIKNPKHINIYLNNYTCDSDILINAFHLYHRTSYNIWNDATGQAEKLKYQDEIFNKFYYKERGILSITQQLDLESPEYIYCRTCLVLLLNYIAAHDASIIAQLSKPNISCKSADYLILGNNPLEQLDIINSNTAQGSMGAMGERSHPQQNQRASLLELLDYTKTSMGRSAFRARLTNPITNPTLLIAQYNAIESLIEQHNKYITASSTHDIYGSPLYRIRADLSEIKNVKNIIRKIITKKQCMTDIICLRDSLIASNKLLLGSYTSTALPTKDTAKIVNAISTTVLSCIEHTILSNELGLSWSDIENNIFTSGCYADLDELQTAITADRNFIDNLMRILSTVISKSKVGIAEQQKKKQQQQRHKQQTAVIGVHTPPVATDNVSYITKCENTQRGIYLEIPKKYKDVLDEFFANNKCIVIGSTRLGAADFQFIQSSSHNKFSIHCSEFTVSSNRLLINIDKMRELCKLRFIDWSTQLIIATQRTILEICRQIEYLDILQCAAYIAINNGYTKPTIATAAATAIAIATASSNVNSMINATGLRHPIIELIHKDVQYIANDIALGRCSSNSVEADGKQRPNGMLLFGVNAVGKSSLMKSIGINLIMAQAGLYVAATTFEFIPYHYLFTRIKNSDNIYAGLSSFEVEMKEFKIILQYANQNSIILGDELCSGTETQDATALVTSGIIQLNKRDSCYIFATHLHFLSNSSYLRPLIPDRLQLCHLKVVQDAKDPSKLIYTRKLASGSGPQSYGILVCESMNLHPEFIALAKEVRTTMLSTTASVPLLSHGDSVASVALPLLGSSKYNADKVYSICEVCGQASADDIHHINQQCSADNNGIISGTFHKNSKWNLVALCKSCHLAVHASIPTLNITGYIQTSNGIILDYQHNYGVAKSPTGGVQSPLDPHDDTNVRYNGGVLLPPKPTLDIMSELTPGGDDTTTTIPHTVACSSADVDIISDACTDDSSAESDNRSDSSRAESDVLLNNVIRMMYLQKYSPKKMQYHIKQKTQQTIKITYIRNYIDIIKAEMHA